MELSNKNLAYIAIGVGVLGFIISFSFLNNILGIIGLFLIAISTALAVALLKYGYILVPYITSASNIILITDTGYEIPPKQNAIIKKSDNVYYASVFLGIKLYESSLEKTENAILAYNKMFERAMINFKRVVKVAFMMHTVNIAEKKRKLEAKRAEAQLRLQQERDKAEPDVLRIERWQKEVAFYNNQIEKLTLGLRPMRVVSYAMVTEAGLTKEEALSRAIAAGKELATLLSNSLNAEVDFLTADEMLKVFEWEKFMPTTPQELEAATETQKREI